MYKCIQEAESICCSYCNNIRGNSSCLKFWFCVSYWIIICDFLASRASMSPCELYTLLSLSMCYFLQMYFCWYVWSYLLPRTSIPSHIGVHFITKNQTIHNTFHSKICIFSTITLEQNQITQLVYTDMLLAVPVQCVSAGLGNIAEWTKLIPSFHNNVTMSCDISYSTLDMQRNRSVQVRDVF